MFLWNFLHVRGRFLCKWPTGPLMDPLMAFVGWSPVGRQVNGVVAWVECRPICRSCGSTGSTEFFKVPVSIFFTIGFLSPQIKSSSAKHVKKEKNAAVAISHHFRFTKSFHKTHEILLHENNVLHHEIILK